MVPQKAVAGLPSAHPVPPLSSVCPANANNDTSLMPVPQMPIATPPIPPLPLAVQASRQCQWWHPRPEVTLSVICFKRNPSP